MRAADEFAVLCEVDHGKLVLSDRRLFADLVRGLRDGAYELTISRMRATRSIQANKYYWGVCIHLIAEHTGFTPEEVHAWAKAKFIPKRLALLNHNGDVQDEYVIGGSTRKMKVDEFYTFVEQVRDFANEKLELNIPPPDRMWRVRETPEELAVTE